MQYIRSLLGFIKQHLRLIILFIPLTIFFVFYLFPFDDLADKVTEQVAMASRNQVYLQFDKMSLTAMPQPGVDLENVIIQSTMAPNLSMKSLRVAPYLLSLYSLTKNTFFGKASAEGFFGGDINVSMDSGNKLKVDTEYEIEADADSLDVKQLTTLLQESYSLPFTATGNGGFQIDLNFDPSYKMQPESNYDLNFDNVNIPNFAIPLGAIGNLNLPGMKFTKMKITGQLKDRKIIIKEGKLGTNSDSFFVDITGEINLELRPGVFRWGGYDLNLKMNMKKDFQEKLGPMLSLIEGFNGIGTKFKTQSIAGALYSFKVSGSSFQDPNPRFSALQ